MPRPPDPTQHASGIEPDPNGHELVAAWNTLPDLVTANQVEEGIIELVPPGWARRRRRELDRQRPCSWGGARLRSGLEDTTVFPDDRPADDNAALDRIAAAIDV